MSTISKKISWEILLIFILLENAFYEKMPNVQLIISLIEYLFVLFVFVKNKKVGVSYFICFTLLSLRKGLASDVDVSNNFIGVRLFFFSFNILFSFFLSLVILYSFKFQLFVSKLKSFSFYWIFVIYSLLIGIFFTIINVNYADNFKMDLLTYIPFVVYFIICSILDKYLINNILKYCIILSVVSYCFAYVFDARFLYSVNFYLANNTCSYILPIALILLSKYYNKYLSLFLIFILLFFIIAGEYFISGKTIILFFGLFLWWITANKKLIFFLFIPLILLVFNLSEILTLCIDFFKEDPIIRSKFAQVKMMLEISDLYVFAGGDSSIANLVAELLTVIQNFVNEPILFFTGKGFGGAVHDTFGYLAPFAGTSGYNIVDLGRDQFMKMHLPYLEVCIKGGISLFVIYLISLWKSFCNRNVFSGLYFFMLLTVFYVSKEYLLLTILFFEAYQFDCSQR